MRFYTVHENPARRDPDDRVAFVKEGFHWAAFFLPVLWLIYKRAWLGLALYAGAAVLLVLLLVIVGLDPALLHRVEAAFGLGAPALLFFSPNPGLALIGLLFAALCGFEAGDVYRFSLNRRGYGVVAITSGKTANEAELAYFSAHSAAGAAAAVIGGPSSPGGPRGAVERASLWARASEPILGLFQSPDHPK